MSKSDLLALLITVLVVLGLVAYRVLWAASSAASATGLGRLPMLPKAWRRWLFGEHRDTSA